MARFLPQRPSWRLLLTFCFEHWDCACPPRDAFGGSLGRFDEPSRKHWLAIGAFVERSPSRTVAPEGQSVRRYPQFSIGSEDPEPAWRYANLVFPSVWMVWYQWNGSARWQALLEHYPLAFADHAAEFYLAGDTSSTSAIRWASLNFENRPTDEALALLLEAEAAGGLRLCRDDGRPSTHARLMDARRRLIDRGLLCNP